MHIFKRIKLIIFSGLYLFGINCSAVDYTWSSFFGSTNWNSALNWNPNGIPGAGDNVTISGFILNVPQVPAGGATVNDFTIENGALLGAAINLNGGTLTINGNAEFNAGELTNGSIVCNGNSAIFNGSEFNATVTATCNAILLNGSEFNNPVTLTKTGTSTDAGDGNNTFNSSLQLSNTGTGQFRLGVNNSDDFNAVVQIHNQSSGNIDVAYNTATNDFTDTVYIINDGSGDVTIAQGASAEANFDVYVRVTTNSTGDVSFAESTGSVCTFSDHLEVNSTANGTIELGTSGGTSSLATTKQIFVGATGFSAGNLSLKGFTQLGTQAQNITMTGAANLLILSNTVMNGDLTANLGTGQTTISGATFNNELNVTSGRITIRTSSCADSASFTKTATGTDNSQGGNTFSSPVVFKNTSTGEFNIATTNADIYLDSVAAINSDGGSLSLATAGLAHSFDKISIQNSGTGDIFISTNSGATTTFNAPAHFNQSGTGDTYIATDAASSVNFTEDITFENTGTGSILFGNLGGTSSLSTNKSLLIGSAGFSGGVLQLYEFTQNGGLTQNLSLTSNGTLKIGSNSLFEGRLNCSTVNGRVHLAASTFQDTVICSAPDILLNNSTYNDFAQFNFNGTGTSTSGGSNTFNQFTQLNNTATGSFRMGNINPDLFNDSLLINNTGNGEVIVGHNSAGNSFVATNVLNQSGGNVYLGNLNAATCTHSGITYLTNNSNGGIYLHYETGSSSQFNDNIEINSSGDGGIYFGNNGGSGSLINGKTVSPGAAGINNGIVSFYQFTQNGSTPHNIITTGSGKLTFGTGTVFNGPLVLDISSTLRIISATFNDTFTANASRFLSGNGTYNSKTIITKTGGSNDYSDGGNSFNDSLEVNMNGTGNLRFANSTGDSYNDFAEFHWTTGTLQPAYSGTNTFSANIWIDGVLTMDIPGTVRLNGNNQIITMTGVDSAFIETLDMSAATGAITTIGHIILPNPSSTINLGAAILNLNGYELRIHNDNNNAISRTSGYILTEQTDNSSKISWDIGSNTAPFIYPIGNINGTYIPFTVQVTSGDIGTFSVSTYGTGSNNLPLPTSPDAVDHIMHWSPSTGQLENSLYTIDRFWQLDKTGTNVTTDITFTYDEMELLVPNLILEGQLRAQRWNSGTSDWDDGVGIPNIISNTVTVSNVSNFSPWTLADNSNPLPVEWLNFDVMNEQGVVNLNWSTVTETDNSHFTVERSQDMTIIEEVGVLTSEGNSTQVQNYNFKDYTPYSGITYYRIKQTDFDGNQSTTDWQSITISSEKIFVYSNHNQVFISNLSETEINADIRIIGLDGKILSQELVRLSHSSRAYRKEISAPRQILFYEIVLPKSSKVLNGKIILE